MSTQQLVIQSPLTRNGEPLLSLSLCGDSALNVITISGEMDMGTVHLLTELVQHVARQRPDRVVLDMTQVRFFCADGLRAVIRARDLVDSAGGHLVLHQPSAAVLLVLTVTGTDRLFELNRTPEDELC
jgi:anti-anti-sigma factor